jgi:hypothetical protein
MVTYPRDLRRGSRRARRTSFCPRTRLCRLPAKACASPTSRAGTPRTARRCVGLDRTSSRTAPIPRSRATWSPRAQAIGTAPIRAGSTSTTSQRLCPGGSASPIATAGTPTRGGGRRAAHGQHPQPAQPDGRSASARTRTSSRLRRALSGGPAQAEHSPQDVGHVTVRADVILPTNEEQSSGGRAVHIGAQCGSSADAVVSGVARGGGRRRGRSQTTKRGRHLQPFQCAQEDSNSHPAKAGQGPRPCRPPAR